jgi:hypothetical protein
MVVDQMNRFLSRKNEVTPLLVSRSPGSTTGGPAGFVGGSGATRFGLSPLSTSAFMAVGTTSGATLLASISSALSWGTIGTIGLTFVGAIAGLGIGGALAWWAAQRLTPKTFTPIASAAGLVSNNPQILADEF